MPELLFEGIQIPNNGIGKDTSSWKTGSPSITAFLVESGSTNILSIAG